MLSRFKEVIKLHQDALFLSESEREFKTLPKTGKPLALGVGPEGGWSPSELVLIGDRGVTLGPRVLRVDHAAAAAAAILLLSS